jgi:hypothetical protein
VGNFPSATSLDDLLKSSDGTPCPAWKTPPPYFCQSGRRVTYRALKRESSLDDDALEDLKSELIDAQRVAVDEDGKVLVWVGLASERETERRKEKPAWEGVPMGEAATTAHPPSAYTAAHLAKRIRATTVTDGERKTITDLFAALKGSTALIEGLDPEEARTIIDPALQLTMDAVRLCCAPVMAATLPSRLPIHFPLAFTRHKLRPCSKWQRRAWLA